MLPPGAVHHIHPATQLLDDAVVRDGLSDERAWARHSDVVLGALAEASQRIDKITSANMAQNFGQVLINALIYNWYYLDDSSQEQRKAGQRSRPGTQACNKTGATTSGRVLEDTRPPEC
jgi:hypothetical protein